MLRPAGEQRGSVPPHSPMEGIHLLQPCWHEEGKEQQRVNRSREGRFHRFSEFVFCSLGQMTSPPIHHGTAFSGLQLSPAYPHQDPLYSLLSSSFPGCNASFQILEVRHGGEKAVQKSAGTKTVCST